MNNNKRSNRKNKNITNASISSSTMELKQDEQNKEKKKSENNKVQKKANNRIQKENKDLKSKLKKLEQENKQLKEHILKIEETLKELAEKINKLEEEKILAEEKRKRLKKRIKFSILQLISFGIIIFAIVNIIKDKVDMSRTTELSKNLKQYVIENENIKSEIDNDNQVSYIVNFEQLKQINPNVKAWLKVNGVNIDLPVVQANDNNYYLTHSFDRTTNSDGWVSFDYRNLLDGTDKNIIIYGHNRKNNTMFSNLVNILDSNWYDNKENKYITIYTENKDYTYEVFSIYQIPEEDYYIQTYFNSDKSYLNFLNTLKSRSIKDYGVELTKNDQILTLSTCGSSSKYRIVLHARKIK